ncbi:hypothetical protein J7355_10725, partial [Endozoicomonas sp. G2_2]|uniref:hypothetical protein n=1 Tax=Endozoicomonas sp. G2_2 TaxID=2821092 RepID=UPI001ADCEEF5
KQISLGHGGGLSWLPGMRGSNPSLSHAVTAAFHAYLRRTIFLAGKTDARPMDIIAAYSGTIARLDARSPDIRER